MRQRFANRERENHVASASEQQTAGSKIATDGVDIQDNGPLIWQDCEPSPG